MATEGEGEVVASARLEVTLDNFLPDSIEFNSETYFCHFPQHI